MAAKHHLGEVVNSLFRLKNRWKDIDVESKETSFFIINQYCSKEYAKNAEVLNSKGLNSAIGLEIWNQFFIDQRNVPNWFWKKPDKKKIDKYYKDIDSKDFWILENYYIADLDRYKKEIELKQNSHLTAKKRKNSKIAKLTNASIF